MFKGIYLCIKLVILSVILILSSCNDADSSGAEEIVRIEGVPEYYFEDDYLNNRIKEINKAISQCSDGCESFFWITDMHWESELNARESPGLIKYIAKRTKIDKILNGGDTADSREICIDGISRLREAIGSNKVYTVTGNHEIVDASKYENPFRRVEEELRYHNTDIVYGDEYGNRSYFYFDNTENKTRYIGLSSFGIYDGNSCESCYTAEQLEWFKNIALNVVAGWTIVIFTHSLYCVSCATDIMYYSPAGSDDFITAIDNYDGEGIIACVLFGHTHRDRYHIGRTGIPYIITASDRYSPSNDDINVLRIPGTISEQHFEVAVLDKRRRVLKLFSIGANARDGYDDEPGSEVDVRVFNY